MGACKSNIQITWHTQLAESDLHDDNCAPNPNDFAILERFSSPIHKIISKYR